MAHAGESHTDQNSHRLSLGGSHEALNLLPGHEIDASTSSDFGEFPANFKDEEYKKKREKNNEAVRKSRQKTKRRTMETARRVEALKKVRV